MTTKSIQLFRKNLDTSETNLYPLTEAQYVSMENGQTVQEILSDRDSDKYTPVITNSSSTFKVGQGDNVDLSSSMKEGAYDSCVLKGKTMVNCIQEPSSKDVVLPYEFVDGHYVTINDTKESGALGVELKGQTLVNTLTYEHTAPISGAKREGDIFTLDKSQQWSRIHLLKSNPLWIPNETYTTILYDVVGDVSTLHMCSQGGTVVKTPFNNNRAVFTMGVGRDSDNRCAYIESSTIVADQKVSFKVVVLKGDYSDIDIPFFTGMTSCKMPILKSVESLFDAQKIIPNNAFTYSHSTNIGRFEFTNRVDVVANTNIQLPAGTYDISFLVRGACDNGRVAITFAKDGQVWHNCSRVEINYGEFGSTTFKEVKSQRTFDAPVTVTIVGHAWTGGATGSGWCEFKDIRFTPVGKTSILSLPEEVVLRKIRNVYETIEDTLSCSTGTMKSYVNELTLNGSEDWNLYRDRESNTIAFMFHAPHGRMRQIGVMSCDKVPVYTQNEALKLEDKEWCFYNDHGSPIVFINVLRSKLTSPDVAGFKTWLRENNVKIQYPRETPIVTKINLPSTLKSWNTTTHIYSEIPENTLYPILSHSNPTYPVILKPSTKYSIVANSYSNNHTNSAINFNLGGATASTTVGNRVTTITTPSTLSNELLTMSGRGNKLNNVMVIEGDVVGDEPYFEGICDCKSPILSNVGKNLFDINNHTENQWSFSSGYPYEQNTSYGDRLKILGDEIHFSTDGGTVNKGVGYYIPLCKNKDYTFRINKKNGNGNYCVKLFLIHSSEYPLKQAIQQHSKFGINNEAITSSLETNFNSANYDMCAIYIGGGWESGTQTTRSYVFNNISLTESNQQVEPYKSNTTTFDQKDGKTIVLRSLPNGVKDELNLLTGEYIQRVGEVILNGKNNQFIEALREQKGDYLKFGMQLNPVAPYNHNVYLLNDRFNSETYSTSKEGQQEQIYIHTHSSTNTELRVCILPSKLSTPDNVGFNSYLQSNPITVQYELATPIVSTIDVQGFPYAYTNGHVQLSSGSIEQSLTPTVEYSLSANKTGQINSNTKRVSAHQKQLDDFEAMMLTQMVQSAYDKAILQFDYEMQMMSLGGE